MSAKHIGTITMLLLLAAFEWRMWPRHMDVYRGRPPQVPLVIAYGDIVDISDAAGKCMTSNARGQMIWIRCQADN